MAQWNRELCFQFVFLLEHFCGTFADDDAGSHGIAGGHARHDRAVRNAKVFDPIDLKLTVYDRHRIAPHFRGTRLMVVGGGRIANEVFQCSSSQVARHDFAFCEGSKRRRIADLATNFHVRYCGLQVVRVGQCIGLDLYKVVGIGSSQTNLAPAFRVYDTCIQRPGSRGWIELSACLGATQRNFHLAGLQIRSVKTRIALPEEGCLTRIVAGSERLLILPDTTNTKMILKVLPYTWKVLHNRYAQAS